MSSLVARLAKRFARRSLKTTATSPGQVVQHFRRTIDRAPVVGRMPRGVARRALDPDELGGAGGEWVSTPGATRTILHHHGGAYVSGRPASYRNLAARLARELRAEVLLATYRLAPEHPHPAALDDAFATYRALLGRVHPEQLVVSGDSAGGGLTLALLQRIRDEGLPLPAAGVLLSPWADLSGASESQRANAEADDMLSPSMLRYSAEAYLAGADPRTPSASPLLGDLAGLPPLLVCVDDSEILLDDATRIVDGVRKARGDATLLRRTGVFHVWPVLVPVLPEARETVAEIAEFLSGHF